MLKKIVLLTMLMMAGCTYIKPTPAQLKEEDRIVYNEVKPVEELKLENIKED